jgi:hypothetical protein
MLQQEVILPHAPVLLALFAISLRNKGLKYSTITTYMSAIGYVHRLLALPDPVASTLVQKTLASIQIGVKDFDVRQPITLPILQKLCSTLTLTSLSGFESTAMKAIMTVAFYGLFRLGELLCPGPSDRDTVVQLADLSMGPSWAHVKVRHFKHNRTGQAVVVPLSAQSSQYPCPVLALKHYLKIRGGRDGPVFMFPDNSTISKSFFYSKFKKLAQLCNLDTRAFKSHSFRIGGAKLPQQGA